jgi:hypothetical protein
MVWACCREDSAVWVTLGLQQLTNAVNPKVRQNAIAYFLALEILISSKPFRAILISSKPFRAVLEEGALKGSLRFSSKPFRAVLEEGALKGSLRFIGR